MAARNRRTAIALALVAVGGSLVAGPPTVAQAVGFQSCQIGYVCTDLNEDGYDDAVVGNPYATVNGRAEAGTVTILFGDADGRIGEGVRRTITQADGGSRPEVGDHFGWSLSVNQLGLGGQTTLLVGSPDEDAPGGVDAGIAQFFQFQRNASGRTGKVLGSTLTQAGAGGTVEAGDHFGFSVALGDNRGRDIGFTFVGAPGEDVDGVADAGVIDSFQADDGHPGTVPRIGGGEEVGQGTGVFPGTPAPGDRFGATLAIADLETEPFVHWLLIGAPGDEIAGHRGAGSVSVASLEDAYGAGQPWPLQVPIQVITQDSPGVDGAAEAGDGFGSSIAIGNPRRSPGPWEYAIGSPGEDIGNVADAGMVHLFDSVDITLRPIGSLTQAAPGWGTAEAGDRFGASVALRPIDAGLAVGAPGEDVGTIRDGGALSLASGSLSDLKGFRTITLDTAGIPGSYRSGDRFGSAVGAMSGRSESVLTAAAARRSGGFVVALPDRGDVRRWKAGTGGIPATERFGTAVLGLTAQ